jgi:LacI family transcriptional regulator
VEEKVSEKGVYLIYSIFKEGKLSLEGKEKDIAGLIITGMISPKLFKTVKKLKIPFVLIGDVYQSKVTDMGVDVIVNNDYEGTYIATKHLIELGHKRIAFVRGYLGEFYWEREELRGYKTALIDAGITYDENLIVKAETMETDGTYTAVKEFIDRSVAFTGLVYHHSHLGIEVIKALGEKGLKIPDDVSIVGVGGLPELTLVTDDTAEMGRVAVKRLFEKIENPDLKPERIVLSPRLIQHDSTRKIYKKG